MKAKLFLNFSIEDVSIQSYLITIWSQTKNKYRDILHMIAIYTRHLIPRIKSKMFMQSSWITIWSKTKKVFWITTW